MENFDALSDDLSKSRKFFIIFSIICIYVYTLGSDLESTYIGFIFKNRISVGVGSFLCLCISALNLIANYKKYTIEKATSPALQKVDGLQAAISHIYTTFNLNAGRVVTLCNQIEEIAKRAISSISMQQLNIATSIQVFPKLHAQITKEHHDQYVERFVDGILEVEKMINGIVERENSEFRKLESELSATLNMLNYDIVILRQKMISHKFYTSLIQDRFLYVFLPCSLFFFAAISIVLFTFGVKFEKLTGYVAGAIRWNFGM